MCKNDMEFNEHNYRVPIKDGHIQLHLSDGQ